MHTRAYLPYGRTQERSCQKDGRRHKHTNSFKELWRKKCGSFSGSAVGAFTPFLTTIQKIGQAHINKQKSQ